MSCDHDELRVAPFRSAVAGSALPRRRSPHLDFYHCGGRHCRASRLGPKGDRAARRTSRQHDRRAAQRNLRQYRRAGAGALRPLSGSDHGGPGADHRVDYWDHPAILGISALVGGMGRTRQNFNTASAGLLSTLLFLVVIAILLPAVFDVTERVTAPEAQISMIDEHLSLAVSVVLLLLYAANLVYTLITHRDVFASSDRGSGKAQWGIARSLFVMTLSTAIIALEAELVSAALEGAAEQLRFAPVFMGVVVLALVGTAADLFAAVVFARQDKMDIVFGMCVGSAIQIALVVAPILVLASWMINQPMNLVFGSPLDLFAIASTAFVVRAIAADGETTWFEGLLLVGVYVLFALAYYFESPA